MIFSDPDKITTSITHDRPPYRVLLVPWSFINLINVNVRNSEREHLKGEFVILTCQDK